MGQINRSKGNQLLGAHVPGKLKRSLKTALAIKGQSFREWLIEKIERELSESNNALVDNGGDNVNK